MNYGLFSRTVLALLFTISALAQATEGPPLYWAGWGNTFVDVSFGSYTGSNPGGQSCVSSVANPYPSPKLGLIGDDTNCAIGTSLSVSPSFSSQLVNAPLNGLGFHPSDSGANAAAVQQGRVSATATVSSLNDPSKEWLPVTGTNSGYYQENLRAPVSPGSSMTLDFYIQGSTAAFGCLKVNITLVSDDTAQEVSYVPPGLPCSASGGTVNQMVTTPPLMIGPSGTYSINILVTAQQDGTGTSTLAVSSGTYVALGDSYASGAGDKPYGPSAADIACFRSENGYPVRLNQPLALEFVACGGAAIPNITQAGSTAPLQPMSQFSYLNDATKLVTISIGGNDSSMISMFELCLMAPFADLAFALKGYNLNFQPGLPCALQHVGVGGPSMPDYLLKLAAQQSAPLKTLFTSMKTQAPNARVLAVLYPNPMPAPTPQALPCPGVGGIVSPLDLELLYAVVNKLNAVVYNAAIATGVDAVDPNSEFNSQFPGRGVCSTDPLFLTPIQSPTDIPASMHPNSAGEQETARIIQDHLNGGPPGTNVPVQQGQSVSANVNVPPGQGSGAFASTWPGSDIEMILLSPSGRIISRGTNGSDITHTLGPTFEVYDISLPEPGTWTVFFYGISVAPQGETLTFNFTALPRAPGDVDGDGVATCADLNIVKSVFGAKTGESNFDRRADLNNDGVINVIDLSLVARNLLAGATCQ